MNYYFSFYMNKIYAILIHIPASSSKIFLQAWKRFDIFSRSYTFQSQWLATGAKRKSAVTGGIDDTVKTDRITQSLFHKQGSIEQQTILV